MLQQILTEMYIDPDVLDALNEDQKKTLFQKMRQEQVRRWKEREEKLEREGDAECKRTKPKADNRKSVSWLLGRDGDVAVIVIGELDELSSKFISGFGEKKSPTLQNNSYLQTILKSKTTTEPIRAERGNLPRETQPGVSLNLKGKREESGASLPLPVSVSEHLSPPAAEKSPDATGEATVLQSTSCTVRSAPFSVRPATANAAPGSLSARSEIQRPPTATAPTSLSNDVAANPKAPTAPHSQEPRKMQGSQRTETSQAAASKETKLPGSTSAWGGRGRVAQLMKTFSVENSATPPQSAARGIKPPLPSKPSHLRLTSTPTVR